MAQRPENTTQNSARVHPDDRGRLAALNSARQALQGAAPEQKPQTSYYTPLLIQCTLPHSDPKARDWKKSNGDFTLIVSSGVDENLEAYGIPYGSFPRLVLAYIITQVIKTGARRIEFAAYFSTFLHEIGYSSKTNRRGNTAASRTIKNQLMRLLRASITFQFSAGDEKNGGLAFDDVKVAPRIVLWWNEKNPEQGSLFGSYIELSDDFYNAILRAPVPLRKDILAALRKSPLALDVYMWISYRLFTMQATGQEQITLGYGRLQEQFGTGISEANYRSFRRDFKAAFEKVAHYWESPNGEKQLLNYELHETGLTLFRSPLLINVPKNKIPAQAADEEAARLLASRKFSDLVLKQAQQVAGAEYDVKALQEQYFVWIERKGISPKDPKAHFVNFIKTHIKRNQNKA